MKINILELKMEMCLRKSYSKIEFEDEYRDVLVIFL